MLYKKVKVTKRLLGLVDAEKIVCSDCGQVLDEFAFRFPNSKTVPENRFYCKECILAHYIEVPEEKQEFEWVLVDKQENAWQLIPV